MKKILAVVFFFFFGIGAAFAEKVVVQMEWDPYCVHAPYFLGMETGIFSREGLEPIFLPGKGSTIVLPMLAANRAAFGFMDASVFLAAREQSRPVKAVAGIYQANSTALFFRQTGAIKKPQDLEGKTIVLNSKSFGKLHLLAFLNRIGLPPDRVRIIDINAPHGTMTRLVLSGKADGFIWSVFYPKLQGKLVKDYNLFGYFLLRDYGLDCISRVIVANESTIRDNPELVRRFVRACLKSWEQALANPEAAIRALVRRYPEINEKTELASFKASLSFVGRAKKDAGYMSLVDWERTKQMMVVAGFLSPEKVNVKNVFTNDFVR